MVQKPNASPPAVGSPSETSADWVDEAFMSRALHMAWQAAGRTNPNPLVGSVVVKDGVVIGEGYHHRCGDAHAEVEALQRAGGRARGATMYVSLEPCAHYGRTPPCVGRLIDSGLRRVVIPTLDPDENVRGRGAAALRAAGIQVDVGCAETAALVTNVGYYKERLGLGPAVVLKMAMTVDGKIASAPGRRDEITGDAAQLYVHRMRSNSDAVVVGVDTVQTDDPVLDSRLVDCGVPPVPVVLDGNFELPAENRWARGGRQYVVVGSESGDFDALIAKHESGSGRVLRCASDGDGYVDVAQAVRLLSGIGLRCLLVEGGARVFTSFARAGLWDAMFLFYAPKTFGENGVSICADRTPLAPDVVPVDASLLGRDFLHRHLNRRTHDEVIARLGRG